VSTPANLFGIYVASVNTSQNSNDDSNDDKNDDNNDDKNDDNNDDNNDDSNDDNNDDKNDSSNNDNKNNTVDTDSNINSSLDSTYNSKNQLASTKDNNLDLNKQSDTSCSKISQNLKNEMLLNNQTSLQHEFGVENIEATSSSSTQTKNRQCHPLIGFDPLDKLNYGRVFYAMIMYSSTII